MGDGQAGMGFHAGQALLRIVEHLPGALDDAGCDLETVFWRGGNSFIIHAQPDDGCVVLFGQG